MTEPNDSALKHALNARAIRCVANNMARVMPGFRREAFQKQAGRGLTKLELKQRVTHIAEALRAHLPALPLDALAVLVASVADWDASDQDRFGFAAWPIVELAGDLGRSSPREGLEALRRVTRLASAEFAIRAYLDADLHGTLKVIEGWVDDDDHHVRRLVSEGTRPRLPWAAKVSALIDDPGPGLALLEHLKDDPSEYVRRSVANHLNDVAKDHPDRVIGVCQRWSNNASDERLKLIRHALRTLVKRGHPDALRVLGFDPRVKVAVRQLVASPPRLRLGQTLAFSFDVVSRATGAQPLVIDYAVHHVKKSGERTAKTFKLKTTTLQPKATLHVAKRHTIRKISTRTYHSGRHALEILINGKSRGSVEFDLEV